MTIVATVIPERTGLRRRLSEAKRASNDSTPGRRKLERQNQPTTKRMTAGQNAASARSNVSMPITPTLKRSTGSPADGANANNIGASAAQSHPKRFDQE